jgi:hypothetical protein
MSYDLLAAFDQQAIQRFITRLIELGLEFRRRGLMRSANQQPMDSMMVTGTSL